MEALISGLVVLALIFLFLGSGVWVFAGLLMVSVTGLMFLLDFAPQRIGTIASSIMYRSASSWEVAAIPMFIFIGEIIFRTDISNRLFRGLAPWVDRIPGRLTHTNVLGCTLFAAVSGSSAATTATVGKITTTELRERGYNRNLSIGSLAGAGSFGLLIPPSIVMIIYGLLAETSIIRLFAAGMLPGLMIAGLYMLYIGVRAAMDPELAPAADETGPTWGDRMRGLLDLLPVIALMTLILGAIYSGLATPSEAAAVGATAALMVTAVLGQLNYRMLSEAIMGTVKLSAMVCSILVAAAFLSTAMGYLHIPQEIAQAIAALDISVWQLLLILALFYIILGLFLDGISILVMSLPITLPLIAQAGLDPIWFGIYVIILIELGQMTPPVGFNLFVIQGLTKEPLGRIAWAALPFFILMCIGAILICVFPGIALWLPNVLYG